MDTLPQPVMDLYSLHKNTNIINVETKMFVMISLLYKNYQQHVNVLNSSKMLYVLKYTYTNSKVKIASH